VRELTLADLRAILGEQERGFGRARVAMSPEEAIGEAPHDMRATLGILFDLAPIEATRIAPEDLELLMAVVTEFNPDFFDPRAPEKADAAPEPLEALTVAALEKAVAVVIAAGHPNAWEYPWRVFKSAVEALEEAASG
jgi:hypothetical protein